MEEAQKMSNPIVIDKELRNLLPKLTDVEYTALEKAIMEEGCRDPLVVWLHEGQKILIGGHNRLAICRQKGILYRVTIAENVKNRLDAKIWILNEQLGKRNLNDFERARIVLLIEDSLRKQSKERQLSGLKQYTSAVSENSPKRTDTRETLAQIAGVSSHTISRVKRIAQTATADQIEQLQKGNISINRLHHELKHAAKQDLSAEIDRLIRKFKWAAQKEIIPIGTKLLHDQSVNPEQRDVLMRNVVDLIQFLNKMLGSFQVQLRRD